MPPLLLLLHAEYLTFQRIVEAEYELPPGTRLLQVDPARRIGEWAGSVPS